MTTQPSLTDLVERARALVADGRRAILGVVGAPGAGKSTLGAALLDAFGPQGAVLVPMDGFHLANSQLEAQGLSRVKGAIQTFDDSGYAHLLERLRAQQPEEVIYAPSFDRSLEESIGSAIRVDGNVPLVVTEGNYLLADSGAWPRARACLDESWFLRPDDERRVAWLIARHAAFGRTPEEAREWVMRSDEANALLVADTARHADLVVEVTAD